MPYIWIGIIVFAFILKVHTFTFFPLCFIPSALAAFILSLLNIQVRLQVIVFFIMTLISLIFSGIISKKFVKLKNSRSVRGGSLIGKNAIVTEEINNYKNTGTIRVNGLILDAQAEEDDIIYETGLVVIILGMDGVKLVCSR